MGLLLAALAACSGDSGPEGPTEPAAPPPTPLPPPANPAVVSGRVISADGGSVAGLRFFARHTAGTDSVEIAPDGTFEIRLGIRGLGDTDSLDLWVDGADRSARRYIPPLARIGGVTPGTSGQSPFPPEQLPSDVRIILIPTSWTVETDLIPRTEVPIVLTRAFIPANPGDFSFYFQAEDGRALIRSWPDHLLPIRVAIAHAESEANISPEDSVALWESLDDLERRVGVDFFRPVVWDGSLDAPGQIVLQTKRDLGNAVGIGGERGPSWPVGPGDSETGTVTFRDQGRLHNRPLVQHEFMHALGVGHTCAWAGVMSGNCQPVFEHVSATDAAYLLIKRRVRALQREYSSGVAHGGDVWGIEAARIGDRVLVRGLSPYLAGGAGGPLFSRLPGELHFSPRSAMGENAR